MYGWQMQRIHEIDLFDVDNCRLGVSVGSHDDDLFHIDNSYLNQEDPFLEKKTAKFFAHELHVKKKSKTITNKERPSSTNSNEISV